MAAGLKQHGGVYVGLSGLAPDRGGRIQVAGESQEARKDAVDPSVGLVIASSRDY